MVVSPLKSVGAALRLGPAVFATHIDGVGQRPRVNAVAVRLFDAELPPVGLTSAHGEASAVVGLRLNTDEAKQRPMRYVGFSGRPFEPVVPNGLGANADSPLTSPSGYRPVAVCVF